jgi:hypothetical protein
MAAERPCRDWLAVLRFTWRMLRDHPDVVVAAILQALISKKSDAGWTTTARHAVGSESSVRK